jgi:hypothetical protein
VGIERKLREWSKKWGLFLVTKPRSSTETKPRFLFSIAWVRIKIKLTRSPVIEHLSFLCTLCCRRDFQEFIRNSSP